LTKKAPYKGLGADSEEKHEPVSDIDTAATDSLKALNPERPIREADMDGRDAMAGGVVIDPPRTTGLAIRSNQPGDRSFSIRVLRT